MDTLPLNKDELRRAVRDVRPRPDVQQNRLGHPIRLVLVTNEYLCYDGKFNFDEVIKVLLIPNGWKHPVVYKSSLYKAQVFVSGNFLQNIIMFHNCGIAEQVSLHINLGLIRVLYIKAQVFV